MLRQFRPVKLIDLASPNVLPYEAWPFLHRLKCPRKPNTSLLSLRLCSSCSFACCILDMGIPDSTPEPQSKVGRSEGPLWLHCLSA